MTNLNHSTPIQTHCQTHRDQITAYEEFLNSDLNKIRNERNKIRKPFGLLFELPSPTTSLFSLSDPNTTIKPLERKRKPDQQLQPNRVLLAPSVLLIPPMKSPVRFGKDDITLQGNPPSPSWIIYSDDSSEDSIKIDETEFKDGSYETIISEEDKTDEEEDKEVEDEEDEEEEKNDENEPILWNLDSPSSTRIETLTQ
ncbi:uncharacterized protein MELLADRAFT_116220 [Melampsora larici-populina 98AG31]|uniref:Uncharacterized protein n=1 Tax=Melampsora larici-populina (strain 98AG31 / pathotype 3-4-7) TaxID=747676 RepID=F4RJ32_MELLP|nr:uncharacterized protein MELLADRAFT_116220 [Melampsora larici-populina 98AG31]EGG07724.1 hypothetical protein MELLADRAFT_116220 [Melampsora larici-populina 98AG31]